MPPAPVGTTIRTGRLGQSCACARAAGTAAIVPSVAPSAERLPSVMATFPSSFPAPA
ncbi:hypothetical protein GCM10010964_22830 [Caldovatus sediminis]|uniref:Uncharacterized protein n=1 Tax=Caldovatus sediminis TaxID=2041189 RepID=A0A8J2ZC04_9PROT|nr:hypothetical protein [Caldovatus sediminis]GGG34336.1 hypothetical protein GCM10010964_22830 [Caldovatus sediminis]